MPTAEETQRLFDKLVEVLGRDHARTLFELLRLRPDDYDRGPIGRSVRGRAGE